jgi:malonate transporter and related proteins
VQILSLLAPDFILIALGYALRRAFGYRDEFWVGLEKVVYFVLFPALLFKALAQARIEAGAAVTLLETALSATLIVMALAWPARVLFNASATSHASVFQCAFRFNAYVGFAVLGRLHGDAGIAAMAILQSLMVPLVNVAAVWALARHAKNGVWAELARNPLIIATLCGIAWNVSDLPLPGIAADTLTLLAQAALPLGLIAVGASARASGGHAHAGLTAYLTGLKLLALPACAWVIASALGVTGLYREAAVLFAALPAAPTSFILASRMGGDGPLVARILTVQLLVAAATLPLWLALLSNN